MKPKRILLFFLPAVILWACKENPEGPAPPQSEKELTTFKFEQHLNPSALNKTITATVGDSIIYLNLPETIDATHLIATFSFKGKAVFVSGTKQTSGVTPNDFTQPITYTVEAKDGSKKSYTVGIYPPPGSKAAVPHIYITTDDEAPIASKEEYVRGELKIDGKGQYEDYEGRTKIRGRGNTSWQMPKKPYKLKLINKAPLLGLYPHKKWILLANYRVGNLLENSIPYETARLLGMRYVNHMIPVEVTINGEYMGFYDFTEHKEVNSGRIDVGTDGLLLEMDYSYDEEWQFYSDTYTLPVMLKYPEDQEAKARFNQIKDDWNAFEKRVAAPSFPHNNYLDFFSDSAYVKYMIVYMLTDNEEINHVKSTYINKTKNGKYRMGIIWDFDSAYGYLDTRQFFVLSTATTPLFWDVNDYPPASVIGTVFFGRFLQDPHITALLKKRWAWFKAYKYPKLKEHIKAYAEKVSRVYDQDHAKWGLRGASGDLDKDLKQVLAWLDARVDYMDHYISNL